MEPAEETNTPQQAQVAEKNVLTVPVAIIVAGIIIGGAIFLSRTSDKTEIVDTTPAPQDIGGEIASRTLDESDHILGNPSADIVMLEYSDLECPFCKTFHKTMHSILDDYGKDGKVAWAYRHFPLSIHPRAAKEAEATECAFDLAGNTGFWNYVDKIFDVTPANNGLDPAELPKIAEKIGLDATAFTNCLNSGKYASKVKADFDDGLKAGVNGTPHTVLLLKTPINTEQERKLAELNQKFLQQMTPGSSNLLRIDSTKKKLSINGAFPLVTMREIVNLLLK